MTEFYDYSQPWNYRVEAEFTNTEVPQIGGAQLLESLSHAAARAMVEEFLPDLRRGYGLDPTNTSSDYRIMDLALKEGFYKDRFGFLGGTYNQDAFIRTVRSAEMVYNAGLVVRSVTAADTGYHQTDGLPEEERQRQRDEVYLQREITREAEFDAATPAELDSMDLDRGGADDFQLVHADEYRDTAVTQMKQMALDSLRKAFGTEGEWQAFQAFVEKYVAIREAIAKSPELDQVLSRQFFVEIPHHIFYTSVEEAAVNAETSIALYDADPTQTKDIWAHYVMRPSENTLMKIMENIRRYGSGANIIEEARRERKLELSVDKTAISERDSRDILKYQAAEELVRTAIQLGCPEIVLCDYDGRLQNADLMILSVDPTVSSLDVVPGQRTGSHLPVSYELVERIKRQPYMDPTGITFIERNNVSIPPGTARQYEQSSDPRLRETVNNSVTMGNLIRAREAMKQKSPFFRYNQLHARDSRTYRWDRSQSTRW